MNIGRTITPGKKVDLSKHTKKPEYKLGTQAMDRYGRPWIYIRWKE